MGISLAVCECSSVSGVYLGVVSLLFAFARTLFDFNVQSLMSM